MRITHSMLALAAILSCSGSAFADQASPVPSTRAACFFAPDFESWKAPDNKTIFIRVRTSRFYRLDLSGDCPALMTPASHLVMNVRGPDTICSAIDWDLKVTEDMHGIPEACIVKTMTQLTPADVAAIPAKYKP